MNVSKFIYSINICILALACNYSFAQLSDNQSDCYIERVFLHYDKPYYVTGESIGLAAYLMNENNRNVPPKSQVLYVDLVTMSESNSKADIITHVRIELDRGKGKGKLLIPSSISTGRYQLRAYTKYMLNFDHQLYFYKAVIPIVNSFSLPEEVNSHNFFPDHGNPPTDTIKESSTQVTVNFQNIQAHYVTREKVAFDIILKDKNDYPLTGTFSVTVVDANLYEQGFQRIPSTKNFLTNEYPVPKDCGQNQLPIAPEERSNMHWQLRKNGAPLPLHKVILFMIGKRPRYFEKKTSHEGLISLSPTDLQGINKIYIHSLQGSDEGLSVVRKEGQPDVPVLFHDPQYVNREELEKYIQTMQKVSNIREAYETVADTSRQASEMAALPIGDPSEVIYPEEYTSFPTLPEVIREVVPGVKINFNQERYKIGILNQRTKMYAKGDPIIFINNIPVFDVQLAMELDPAKVQRIEIVRPSVAKSALGTLGENGALSIFTWNAIEIGGADDHLSIDVSNFYTYGSSDFLDGDEQKNIPEIPDFRTAVYWNPEVRTDNDGKVNIQFFNSDIVSRFMIKVQGITDSNEPISGTYYYETSLTGQ